MDNRTKLALTSHPVQSRAQWYNDAIDCSLDDVIADGGGPAWTEQAFEHLLRAARSSLRPRLIVATDAVERLAPLTAELDRRLAVLADTDTLGPSVNDAAAHFRRLVYPGFLAGIGFDHLTDLGRFLEAIGYRLDRLADNPRSDLLKAAECVAVEQKHRRLVDQLGLTIELEEIVWQLEELRVAQFAQHLRQTGPSAVKVSARRIERRLDRLAGKQ
jgi:ATP-dependent helicase HrpA